MNISDFVNSVKIQLSDLENVGEIGYVDGISNIIIKNLKELDVTQRPVHCTDKKRETIYIKDENKWEKDEDNKKLHKVVRRVT
jgi:small nuclear ribonucleoprotein (snRNP)-like protein